MNHISRDVASLIKDWADPISYGRLLCTCRVFSVVNVKRKQRKLKALLSTLPQGNRAKRGRSAYIFFMMNRHPELKDELDATFAERGRQIGIEWRRLTVVERLPYNELAAADKVRYARLKQPEVWAKLSRQRNQVAAALADCESEETILMLANNVRKTKRRKRENEVYAVRRRVGWYTADGIRAKREIYRRHKIPKQGKNSYQCYVSEQSKEIRKWLLRGAGESGSMHFSRINQELGRRWKAIKPVDKAKYEEMSRVDRLEKAKAILEAESAPNDKH
jgi:hypothetical protein